MRKAKVFMNNDYAGMLIEESRDHFVFQYDMDYLANPSLPAISLTMPKNQQEYLSSHLFPFFSNLVAEGGNLLIQERINHIDAEDSFGILLATAKYDSVGAIRVIKVDE